MSKKTLYAYFPSKLALLHAVMDQRVASIDQALQRLTQEPGLGFAERVNSAMRYLSGRLGEVKAPFLLDVKRHAPEVFRKVEVFRQQRIPQYFGQLLGEGRRQGMIRPDLEPQVVVAMLLNTVQSLLTPEAVIRLNMPLQQVFQTILRVVFAGLLTTKARNQLRGKEFAFVNQC
jgi:AcrR family transcriptional regulator